MKRFFIILILFITSFSAFAQDDDKGKIRDRMNEYIQQKLGLSKSEADKFTPVFLRYFKDFNQTHRQYRDDILLLKQKIIELRIRYRTEYRQMMDEQRANKVFVYEDDFRKAAIQILENRRDRLGEKALRRNGLQ